MTPVDYAQLLVLSLLLMVAAVLMEEERNCQKHQGRHQRQAALPLDLARVIERARNGR